MNREALPTTTTPSIVTADMPFGTVRSPSTGLLEDSSSALFQAGALFGSRPLAEGLRMGPDFSHEPAMVDEVVALFATVPGGVVVDATVGGGGHAAALLDSRRDFGLLGVDRDPLALEAAAARLGPYGSRAALVHARFGRLGEVVVESWAAGQALWTLAGEVDAGSGPHPVGVLLDLGVSSPQLDTAERGFSYRQDGPLDMRMDPTVGRTAAELVNQADEAELARLFAENGEGRLARRIARAVVAARPVTSTGQLADVVARAVPAPARRRGHPARRVFQALRIDVNDELGELARVLPAALDLLALGGRCVVISYHSGEDRLVKRTFAEAVTGGCVCPPGLPCGCGAVVEYRLVFSGSKKPSPAEIERNHRVESARLRVVERVEPGPARPGRTS